MIKFLCQFPVQISRTKFSRKWRSYYWRWVIWGGGETNR